MKTSGKKVFNILQLGTVLESGLCGDELISPRKITLPGFLRLKSIDMRHDLILFLFIFQLSAEIYIVRPRANFTKI